MPKAGRHHIWLYALTALLGGAIIASLPLLLLRHAAANEPDPTRIVLTTIVSGSAIAWALLFATFGFRQMDEFLQHRSRVAWYWGGLVGLAVSFPVYSFIAAGGLWWLFRFPVSDPSPYGFAMASGAFSAGYGLLMFMELLGFFIAWAWWRIARQ